MQCFKIYPQPHSDIPGMSLRFIQSSTFRNKTLPTIRRSAILKEPTRIHHFSTYELFPSFPQHIQSKKRSWDDVQSYAKHCVSLIEDPLWKKVCTELINMMGPESVLKIWNSNLGSLSSRTKTIDLSCQTKETAKLIQQYDFVILEILRRYFPALKEVRVCSNSLSWPYNTCRFIKRSTHDPSSNFSHSFG